MHEGVSNNTFYKYVTTIVLVVLSSIIFANLEYNYILLDALPYREA